VRRPVMILSGVALVASAAWLLVVGLPRWYVTPNAAPPAAVQPADGETGERKIRATLFYVAEDGVRLVGVEREITYAANTVEQAQRLITEQLQPVQPPLVHAIPEGTRLRALFVTEHGEAFVDFSPEISARHSGGSLDELFTVYAIVNLLTANLPAITGVQILVDGKEVDTLAGHIDLRRPLSQNLTWVRAPAATPQTP
jgi:spore germination protein GerM